MSVYFETKQPVIQSTPMADFLLSNGQKHFKSVAENLISNKQKRTKRICQEWQRHGHYKTLKPIFLNRS